MSTLGDKATRADVQAALAELDSQVSDADDARRRRHLAAHKDDRGRLSDNELMFESLADRFDFDAGDREVLHMITARAMDKSPDDPLVVNEVDVGRQLPGDDDVTAGSFKRRTVRAVETKANLHGKTVLKRIPGKWSVASGKDAETGRKLAAREEKKVGARYHFHWPQAIAEGVAIARALRAGNRRSRFRRAAEVVFDSELFPSYTLPAEPSQSTPVVPDADDVSIEVTPEETIELLTGETPKATARPATERRVSPMRIPRTVRRVKDNAALALRAAKERDEKRGGGSAEFNRQAAWLFVELMRTTECELSGRDLGTGEAIRQIIELLKAVESDPAELSRIEASTTYLEANTTQDSVASDLPGGQFRVGFSQFRHKTRKRPRFSGQPCPEKPPLPPNPAGVYRPRPGHRRHPRRRRGRGGESFA